MSFHKDTIRVAVAMSGTTVTASTSVVLVPTSSNYTRPFIVTFPNISTFGRLITVRDNDGFASTGNTIVLSTTSATAFNGVSGPLTINQPYGFITLTSQANGTYSVLNTFAFPAGQAAANVSNLNAQVVNIQSTLTMYDFGTGSTNTIYTSSSQFIFNGNYIGQITSNQLASTVTNLGTTGYLSSIPVVYVVPPTWIAVGQSSTISQASSTGSLVYSSNSADWFNASGGKGFTKYGAATAYGEAYYIAVGNNDTGAPNAGYNQWSFNARDWYYSYGPSLTATQARTACLYANGLYHSVGCNNGVGGPNTILWSDDGKTWAPSLGSPFVATDGTGYATGIAFGSGNGASGVWVCSGVQNTLAANYSLLWSTDGSNWNPAASVSFGNLAVMDVAFDGTRFVALCTGGAVSGANNVCISTDGSNWSSAGITGGNFLDQPRYVTGSNGIFVATTGNPGQSLVYSLDGAFTWQSNANISALNVPMYKPYYDGLKWWIGVETNNGSQSIYYTTQSAPALSNWVNGGFTGGFSNGAVARAFVSTDGQSNVTAILNSTIFGLSQTFTTSNLNASTISAGKAYVGELTASTLYIGVVFVSTTYETINNISTQNVDFISAGTLVSSRNFLDSLSVNRVSVGQIVGGPARFQSLSTNSISTATVNTYTVNSVDINTTNAVTTNLIVNSDSVSLGNSAGSSSSGAYRVAIGASAGLQDQSGQAIAIGYNAGYIEQGANSIAIGNSAGSYQQGANSIAIGNQAAADFGTPQPGNSIILNASGTTLSATTGNSLYVKPIRSDISYGGSLQHLLYNPASAEITCGPGIISTFSNVTITGNLAAASISTSALSTGQTVGGPARFQSLSTNTISSGTAFIGRLGVNRSTIESGINLDVLGPGQFTQYSQFSTNTGFTLELANSPGSNQIQFFTNLDAGSYGGLSAPEDMGIIFSKGAIDTGNLVIGPWANGAKGIKIMSTGNVGIGTPTPQYTLDVNGSVWARSTLYVGSNSTTNQIRFYGTTGDDQTKFTHTVIGEYLYEAGEKSELLLFKGNDTGAGASGPDRVRVLASGGFKVDTGFVASWPEGGAPPSTITYENALFVSGENGRVGINTSTPTQTLDVFGNFVTRTTTGLGISQTLFNDDSSQRYMEHRGPRGAYIDFCAGATDYDLRIGYFSTNFAEIRTKNDSSASTIALMPKEGTGRVGINTETPSYTLDVSGDLRVTGTMSTIGDIYTTGNITASNSGSSCISRITGSVGEIYFQAGANTTTGSSTKVHFSQWATTNVSMSVDLANYRVGINQVNPATTLDVNGIITQNGQRTVTGTTGSIADGAISGTIFTATRLGMFAITFNGVNNGTWYYRIQGVHKSGINFIHDDVLTYGTAPFAQVTSGTSAGVSIAINNNTGSADSFKWAITWLITYD